MDPSLNNWGLAYGMYDPGKDALTINTIELTQTLPTKTRTMRVNTDDLQRAKLLSDAAFRSVQQVDAVFVEVPYGSQSARAMVSYGVCIGILASLRTKGIPFFEISYLQVKLVTIGKSAASKEQITNRAIELHPHLDWPKTTKKGKTTYAGSCHHMADAIGAIEAGVLTNEFQQLLAIRQSQ